MADSAKMYAVVTGSNKGIGFGIVKLLASKGITVVLTARNEIKGLEAIEKLKPYGLSDLLVFHQLDVLDPASVDCFADFIKTKFGKLDILVNNAGVGCSFIDPSNINDSEKNPSTIEDAKRFWSKAIQDYELAENCLKTNYYGVKRITEALNPLLQLSDSPRIVNVSSGMGMLKHIPNPKLRGELNDIEKLTEERLDELLTEFLKDFKEGSLESKGWPVFLSAYTVSKVAVNALTRMLAKQYPHFVINCVCPGFVKTDINYNTGFLSIEQGAATPVKLALLPNDGPSGLYFVSGEVHAF